MKTFRQRATLVGGLGTLLAIGLLSSQTKTIDHSRYKVLTCQDSGTLLDDRMSHRGTIYEDEQKAALKTDCDSVLIGAGTPVLYMGRDHSGRHLVLVKEPF
jgi:hypothetical protein